MGTVLWYNMSGNQGLGVTERQIMGAIRFPETEDNKVTKSLENPWGEF